LIWFDLLLVILGLMLAITLHRRGSPSTSIAIAGTVLGIFAIITGFSIGVYIAPLAAVVLLFAARGLRSGDHVT